MKRFKMYLLNTLIILYIGIMYFAGVPDNNLVDKKLNQFANKTSLMLGFWPSWSMFAPNPIKFDAKTFVKITYKDGKSDVHDLERKLSGPFKELRRARWMKFAQDNIRSADQKSLLNPIIRHYLFKYNSLKRPISQIQIIRKWRDIPSLEKDGLYPIKDTPKIYNELELISQKI